MDRNIVISFKTILLTLLVIFAGYIVYRLGPVFAILVIAGLIVLALEPAISWIKSKRLFGRPISRSAAVIITYALFLFTAITTITLGLPPVISQGQKLVSSLPALLSNLRLPTEQSFNLSDILPKFSSITTNVFQALFSGFSLVATVFTVVIVSIYMSLDWENLKRKFIAIFPDKHKLEVLRITEEVESNIGQWVKAQLSLMLLIGVLTLIALVIIQVPYALALSLIAGLLEVVPIMGPVIAAVVMSIIAFADSPIKGLMALGLFILIQQLESNILVPKVMQRFSGFSPLVVLIALLIGSTFLGIVGAIMAVPLTMVLVIVAKSIIRHTRENNLA